MTEISRDLNKSRLVSGYRVPKINVHFTFFQRKKKEGTKSIYNEALTKIKDSQRRIHKNEALTKIKDSQRRIHKNESLTAILTEIKDSVGIYDIGIHIYSHLILTRTRFST